MENNHCVARVYNSLVKIFPEAKAPVWEPECGVLTALLQERVSFQVAYSQNVSEQAEQTGRMRYARVEAVCDQAADVQVRQVVCVPNSYPAHKTFDDNYLRTEPGMYPDLLEELRDGLVSFSPTQWKALWVDVRPDAQAPEGRMEVRIRFTDPDTGELLCEASQEIMVYRVSLPEQTLKRTEWFHADCLADYYHVPVFSEAHWEILERFIRCAAQHGINMLLTPVFTPPLDTAVGGERTTVQLVEVYAEDTENGRSYRFDFAKLVRWIRLCLSCGISYIEISHLFSQWGAVSAPKVMAYVNGAESRSRIFGWETPAVGGAYTEFLRAFLPQLLEVLRREGVGDRCFFHISDEPSREQQESYRAARESVAGLLEGQVIMDALSDLEFYQKGYVTLPVCATNHIHTFLDAGVHSVWSYYCTAQWNRVSNRFLAMPSARTRIYGLQLFKYQIEGCLHWGFNFYNAAESRYPIDPFGDTASGGVFPGGDPFLVYPGPQGAPQGSIRLMVMEEAMNDLRAMNLLASYIGREAVIAMLQEDLPFEITFETYPKSDYYLLRLRAKINAALARHQKG
ncbi:MAG: DUF4091 domain-containing protein [Eubacteriales bacterium]|nr:DUF4091 domain-containing protein [Eubacteriales bacterium]